MFSLEIDVYIAYESAGLPVGSKENGDTDPIPRGDAMIFKMLIADKPL